MVDAKNSPVSSMGEILQHIFARSRKYSAHWMVQISDPRGPIQRGSDFTYVHPFPPHCPNCVCVGPLVIEVEDGGPIEELGILVLQLLARLLVNPELVELDDCLLLPDPGAGPATDVVIGAGSMYITDQYQSSGAELMPALGRRRTPTYLCA